MFKMFKRLKDDVKGVTVVEYGLLLGLVSLVCITAATSIGTNLSAAFNTIAGKM